MRREIPKVNEICWLIKKENTSINTIGFLRNHKDGFFIIGGETGSHFSGHSETWQRKWEGYLTEGYIPVNIAIEKGIIKGDWKPLKISKNDQDVINKINNKLI